MSVAYDFSKPLRLKVGDYTADYWIKDEISKGCEGCSFYKDPIGVCNHIGGGLPQELLDRDAYGGCGLADHVLVENDAQALLKYLAVSINDKQGEDNDD